MPILGILRKMFTKNNAISISSLLLAFYCLTGCTTIVCEKSNVLTDAVFVKIPGKNYEMLSTEVTQKQWCQIMKKNVPWYWYTKEPLTPSESDIKLFHEGTNYPAAFISWNDAVKYCEILSSQDKEWNYRLPTGEEWEHACRAGSNSKYCFGDDESELKNYAWYLGNLDGKQYSREVGKKKANAFGLYDMHGNMSEWTSTRVEGKVVSCGGGYLSTPEACTCLSSEKRKPNEAYIYNGFRIIREPKK